MQVSGIGIKEKLENSRNGVVADVNKPQADIFEHQYENAVVMERQSGRPKEYHDVDVMEKQPEEKSPLQLSMEVVESLGDSVTPEDYSIYTALGLAPEADDPTAIVTVTDRIKMEMAAHCEDYQVFGDIDLDMVKNIYGDTGLAYSIASSLKEHNLPVTQKNIDTVMQALEMAEDIKDISKESQAYILENNLNLTIENVYISCHANATEDTTLTESRLSEDQWESLKMQVADMLEQAGIEAGPDNLSDARWMIENKIPVTVENIQKMSVMKEFTGNIGENEWIDSIVAALSFGIKAQDTMITGQNVIEETAGEFVDTIQNVQDETLLDIIQHHYVLNVNNMKRFQKENNRETGEASEGDINLVKARRQVEEIRLMMTVSSGVKMMMKGIDIDLRPVEDIIKELKQQEEKYCTAMFESAGYVPEDKEIDLFQSVTDAMEALKSTPSYVLGNVLSGETEFEPGAVVEKGAQVQAKLMEAGEAYETMRTQPRKDLGDSISKAFESVDDILRDLDMDTTETSRRAVRILTYNNMELTKENIDAIKQLDVEVTRLMDNMTPKTVVHLIFNGINPLNTNIEELNDRLDEINHTINPDYGEKYSEFLWRLEQDNSISAEERGAYIGIYRLLHMVAKGDRSVIGALVSEGADITLNNMLHAVRSQKAQGMDITVDEDLGLTEEIKFDENSISSQLSGFAQQGGEEGSPDQEQRYWQQLLKKAAEQVTPQKLSGAAKEKDVWNMPLEQFVESLEQYSEGDAQYQMRYYEERVFQIQQMVQDVNEEVFKLLLDAGQTPTIENVMAASMLMSGSGKIFNRIKKYDSEGELKDKIDKIGEFDGDEEDIQESYESLNNSIEKIAEKYLMSGKGKDIEELIRLKKSFRLMKDMGSKETYHIPVEINGETAGIRVTIIKNSGEKGKVTADVYSDVLGKISAEFTITGNHVDGIIVADSDDTVKFLEGVMPQFEQNLEREGFVTPGVGSARHDKISYGMWSVQEGKEENVKNSSLYKVAKIFISDIKEWGKDLIRNE